MQPNTIVLHNHYWHPGIPKATLAYGKLLQVAAAESSHGCRPLAPNSNRPQAAAAEMPLTCSEPQPSPSRRCQKDSRLQLPSSECHGAGGAVRTQVSKGSGRAGGRANGRVAGGRSVGRAGRRGGAAARGVWFTFGRAAERERDLFLREDRQEVAWRGKGSLHAPPLIWTTHADMHRTLDRARASPGHHHLYTGTRSTPRSRPSDGA